MHSGPFYFLLILTWRCHIKALPMAHDFLDNIVTLLSALNDIIVPKYKLFDAYFSNLDRLQKWIFYEIIYSFWDYLT